MASLVMHMVNSNATIEEGLITLGITGVSFYLSSLASNLFTTSDTASLKKNVSLGVFITSIGFVALSAPLDIYIPLATISIGYGLIKPNIPTILGQLLGQKEKNKTFQAFYLFENLGAVLAGLICGIINFRLVYAVIGFCLFASFFLIKATPPEGTRNAILSPQILVSFLLFIFVLASYHLGFWISIAPISFFVTFKLFQEDFFSKKVISKYVKLFFFGVFMFFLYEQEYFLVQKLLIDNVNLPFTVPVFFAINPTVVILGSLGLIRLYRRDNLTTTLEKVLPSTFGLLVFAAIILFLGTAFQRQKETFWIFPVLTIVLQSISEMIFVPQFIKKLSSGLSKNKNLGMIIFFLVLACARFLASKFSVFYEDNFTAVKMLAGISLVFFALYGAVTLQKQ